MALGFIIVSFRRDEIQSAAVIAIISTEKTNGDLGRLPVATADGRV
jgi:hypothetical protein